MAKYVLVGGAWLGGWCWKPIARHLRNQGHDAYPVTLTGLGERSHLAGPEVDLELTPNFRELRKAEVQLRRIYLPGTSETCTPKWKNSRPVLPCLAEGKRHPASRIGESLAGNDTAAHVGLLGLRSFALCLHLRAR